MKKFKFSKRSLSKLEGLNPSLVAVAHKAISYTTVDFGVTEGLRTIDRQRKLYELGATKILNSKHLIGHAIDVVAYVGNRISWEFPLYADIAEAFKMSAIDLSVGIRWGGMWDINDIRCTKESLFYLYSQKEKRGLIDGPHFELATVNC